METQEHRPLPHRTYIDRIQRDFPGENHDLLLGMLRRGYNFGYRGRGCTIHVVDHGDDQITKKSFDLHRDSDVTPEFMETLERGLPENGVRFVVVAYGNLYDLNFSYVGYIALTLDLQPSFLSAHFERIRRRLGPKLVDRSPRLRLSDARHMEFIYPVYNSYMFYSSHLYSNMAVSQSVIFNSHGRAITIFKERSLQNSPRPAIGDEDKPLESFLKGLSHSQIQACSLEGSHSLIEYFAPFLEAWALHHATTLATLDDRLENDEMTPDYLHKRWKGNRRCMKSLESVVHCLSKCLHTRQDLSCGIEALFQEYTALLQKSRDQSQDMMAFIQQISAMESIHESQKGVQSAESVRRLTVVAFVFIPLTFATSFFGMNVRQLGTGGVDVGFFVLTAVAAACLSMGLAFGLGPWERAVTRTKERLHVSKVGFADVIRESTFGQRFLEKLDRAMDSLTFHEATMIWAKSRLRDLRAWALSFRETPRQDEATPDQNSHELTPIA